MIYKAEISIFDLKDIIESDFESNAEIILGDFEAIMIDKKKNIISVPFKVGRC